MVYVRTLLLLTYFANGKKVESRTVTATTAWTGSFDHLPKYENGREIVYTLEEEKVSDYSASIDQVNYILTNTYVPGQTHLTVTKYWDDENNKGWNFLWSLFDNLAMFE